MIRFLPYLAVIALATVAAAAEEETSSPPASGPSTEQASSDPQEAAPGSQAAARRGALELAGAFSNDGYKIRDGFWFSSVDQDKPAVIRVNLFAGNEYWFCANGLEPTEKLDVIVFDSTGHVIDQQEYHDESRAAAGVEPTVSGEYFVQVSLTGGEKGDFCLLYCYK